MGAESQKLLILDLDETLIFASEERLPRSEDFRVGRYFVYRRPGLEPFLHGCFERFEVAVWTSSTRSYAEAVVAAIFPSPERLTFLWARDRCTLARDTDSLDHYWRKNLRKIRRKRYRAEAVLVVDDSPEKWRQSYGNLVRVPPYRGEEADDALPRLLAYLDELRTLENVRTVEKRLWMQRRKTV